MAGRWVPAQDLFDEWSREEDGLAFERAGGHAYDFALTPPVERTVVPLEEEAPEADEFELEDTVASRRSLA